MFFKSFPVFDFLSYLGKNTIILLCSHTRVLTFIKLIILIVGGSAVFNFNEFTKIGLTVLQIILMIPIIHLVNKYLPLLNGKIKKD
jgi:fucose 4-O-acetylase-like acetyltransferase